MSVKKAETEVAHAEPRSTRREETAASTPSSALSASPRAALSGWQTVKLAELTEVFADGDWIESKDQSPDGIRLIQTGNVGEGEFKDRGEKARYVSEPTFDRLRCTEIFAGDCLISRLPDPVGRACLLPDVDERMITAVDCTIVRFKRTAILPEFFLYYSQSSQYLRSVDSETTGTTRKRISRNSLGQTPILVPPISEQRRIVGILDEALAGIAAAKAHAERNRHNARALFESHLHAVFSHPGPGWREAPLSDLTERITKGSSPKWQGISYVPDPGILFVTSENVGEYGMLLDSPKYVEDRFNEKDRKSVLRRGDVLTNIVGASIGRTAIFDRDDVANINQAVCLIRCRSEVLDNAFLMYLLNSPVLRDVLHANEVNMARANLSLGFFSELQICFPSLTQQQRIVRELQDFHAETRRLEGLYERKAAALDELKQSLLHQAFSGQL